MKKSIRVAHLGSFEGNSGDGLNHAGFRIWLEGLLSNYDFVWKPFEIRNIHRKAKSFRDYFELLDECDLGVIGGGNFFELWVEGSQNGTTLDFSIAEAEASGKPILFNALGVYADKGISKSARDNFSPFVRGLMSHQNFLVTVRNDGSDRNLSREFGLTNLPTVIPDHGFFGSLTVPEPARLASGRRRVALNIAADMPESRFSREFSFEAFIAGLASTLKDLASEEDIDFLLVPHIYSDLKAMSALLDEVPDDLRRHNFEVSGLRTFREGHHLTFSNYLGVDLALTMRFHAGVFCLARGVNTIGLGSDTRIISMFNGLGLGGDVVQFTNDFSGNLANLIRSKLDSPSLTVNVMKTLSSQRESFEPQLVKWLTPFLPK